MISPSTDFNLRTLPPRSPARSCRAVLLLAALCGLAAFPGCGVPAEKGPADTYGIDFTLPPDAQKQGAIIFLVDGLSGEVFEDMLNKGQLPAFKKYFVDRGLYAPRAAANIPSVTIANLTSVTTGRFPGHHKVVGVNWFDRNTLIWRNYDSIAQKNTLDQDYIAPTLYEQFPDELTFSLFFQPHRGATKFFENWTSAGPPFFFGWYEYVDRLSLCRLNAVADISREYRRFPAVTVAYLLATDFRAYHHSVSSPEYRAAIRHADFQIGRVLGDLERAGLLDHILIALVSDHSMCDVTQHFDIDRYLKSDLDVPLGSTHWWENDPFEERLRDMSRVAAMTYGSGDRYWALCLRRPVQHGHAIAYDSWLIRPSGDDLRNYATPHSGKKNLPAEIAKLPAVDAVAYQEAPDRVRVVRAAGEVEFRQAAQGQPISYRVIAGRDPLGYAGKVPAEILAGQPISPRRWLEVTAATDFPDLAPQILAYFRATERAGDIAIFAAPGYDFRTRNVGGHGGLRPCDMFPPMLIAGPGVPHQRIAYARTVDLVPTILTLMNRPLPPGLDGQPLVPRPAGRPAPQATTQVSAATQPAH